jgi:TIR domain/FHA domain
MSDIFISYASADREQARLLADALSQKGWLVWWDRTIPPGKEFDQVIEGALDAAKASSWVKTEAAEAMRRKILVPALIDESMIPLEFRRLQAADLSRWEGEQSYPELERLFRSIEAILSEMVRPVPDVEAKLRPPSIHPQPFDAARRRKTRRIAGVLVTYSWHGEGEIFPIREGKNFIGRGDISSEAEHRPCDVCIPQDNQMSAEHALILIRQGNYEILDQSSNGTFLNGQMLKANQGTDLPNYAEIKTGSTLWTFVRFH